MRFVLAAAALFAAIYFALDLNKLHALYYGADNGIFLQSLAHFARDGSAFNWGEARSHWFVHDSWLLISLAPFVRVFPYQETLIAAQVLLIASSSIVLFLFARIVGVARTPAVLLALAYLISPSVQGFAYNDFSESHFEPVLIFALAIAAHRRSLLWTLLCAQALLGVKEDIGLFLIWFGIIGAVWYDRRCGVAVALLALMNELVYHGVLALQGQHAAMPAYGLGIVHPPQDIGFLLEMLAPFAFAPLLLRWRIFVVIPLLAELFLATNNGFPLARAGVHYTEALVCLIAVGTALVLRERPVLARWAVAFSLLMAVFVNTTVLHVGRHLYVADEEQYARARALVATQTPASFDIDDEGAWAVAAGDLNAKLVGFGRPMKRQKPAWNTK